MKENSHGCRIFRDLILGKDEIIHFLDELKNLISFNIFFSRFDVKVPFLLSSKKGKYIARPVDEVLRTHFLLKIHLLKHFIRRIIRDPCEWEKFRG